MGNYTEAIEKLIDIIESKYNFKVIKYCFDLPENVVGRIDYQKQLIMLNEPIAKEALVNYSRLKAGAWFDSNEPRPAM